VDVNDWAAVTLATLGTLFFVAGTAGLLRFPDVHSRLHAITKADNLGLGLIVAGLAVRAGSLPVAAKLATIWLLALAASATSCYLIARRAAGGNRQADDDRARARV
jgi:multicomponent Na+:H+ antiporter subunit G